jgi:hypothetical protein
MKEWSILAPVFFSTIAGADASISLVVLKKNAQTAQRNGILAII